MSAIPARSRSLRKPTTSTTSSNYKGSSAIPSSTSKPIDSDPRHGSPSRLPVNRPPARSVSTATSSNGSAKSLPGARTSTTSSGVGASSSRQNEPLRKESTRYPPSTTTTRHGPSTTTARPTSSDGTTAQAPRRVAVHTRARSTVTAGSSLNPPTVLRPPSQGSGATGPRTAHRRVASTDKRATPAAAPPETNPPTTMTTATATATKAAQPRLRPAFSTLQQHYSPAKSQAPKPLTSTYLAPPSPSKLPANVAASAETTRLQTELLQLHLLHREAEAVGTEWQASARAKLGERFELLGRDSREVAEQERTAREEETVLTLRALGSAGGGLEAKIQALDAVITGVWTLTEPGGRYARVIRRFERWLDQVSELQSARHHGAAMHHRMGNGQALFVCELDTPWKDELPGLQRRLIGWQRQLNEIGEPPGSHASEYSSLSGVLRGLRESVEGMLDEVHFMEEIEQDAQLSEEAWIEATNREDDDIDIQQAGAIWRVV